ncbi:hypothetical protein PENCOP_c011G06027 [Penicillium coprophilum]|uniref:DUF3669 domain-containing protein n=1 Tax=Penicillium coprophilum TaxID=36646 RepID=A0A1V6UE02_9EURO|nr:hypothetical protein PENCOP_c011G06027 [Penicillium coprophilum]
MDQRREDKHDESQHSGVLPIAQSARIFQLLTTKLGLMADSEILKKSLSLNTQLNQIGAGLQGAVFEQVGKPLAMKKETPGNETLRSKLYHEYILHCNASAVFEQYRFISSEVRVPKPVQFISREGNSAFWGEILPKTPQPHRMREDIVVMEQFLPLPKVVRKALISVIYAPEQNLDSTETEALLNHPTNEHYLAQIYLGKTNRSIDHRIPLRNFPPYLETMEQTGSETLPLASAMGKVYAILHWGAAINGEDVDTARFRCISDFGQGEAVDLTHDPDVVYQAFKGAMVTGDNQHFISQVTRSPALFATFRQGYLEAGNIILSHKRLKNKFNMEDFMQEYVEYAEDFL